MNIVSVIKRVVKSKSLCYVVIRYITYAIQFLISLLLVKYLDVFEYGVYAFTLLFQQYASYANLGVNESLNVEYVKYHKSDDDYENKIWGASWFLSILFSLLLVVIGVIFIYAFNDFGEKYDVKSHGVLLLMYCALANHNKIYITYYKLFGILWKINVQQLLPHLLLLISIFIFTDIDVSIILWSLLAGNLLSLLIFKINQPGSILIDRDITIYKNLLGRGISLLIYNMSFYFIVIAASTCISYIYSVELFGEYSFANSITNAVTMAGGAFLFVYYPKMLSKFNSNDVEDHRAFIEKIRSIYIYSIDLITFAFLLFLPLFRFIAPSYHMAGAFCSVLIIGKILNNSNSGYSTYLIAKGCEGHLIWCGVLSIITVLLICAISYYLDCDILYMVSAIPCASLLYSILTIRRGRKIINASYSIKHVIKDIFGSSRSVIYISILLAIITKHYNLFIYGGFILFIALNFNRTISLFYDLRILIDNDKLKI